MFVGCFFVIKLGPSAEQAVSISFFRVALSPSEVLLIMPLQATHSLLHDVPGSEYFYSKLAWSFLFADEF